MKTLVQNIKSMLFPVGATKTVIEPWITVAHKPCTQTHWCEVQTDLDEEIARA